MNQRPGKLTAVCVVAIVLGALGLLGALGRVAGLAVGSSRNASFASASNQSQKVVELQKQMQEEVEAVTKPWKGLQIVLLVGSALTAGGLLLGGSMTLGLKEVGAKILWLTLLLVIPFDLVVGCLGIFLSHNMAAIMGKYMPQIMQASMPAGGAVPPPMGGVMSSTMQIVFEITQVFMMVWVACKLWFYIVSALYLRRPAVQALFASPPNIPNPNPPPAR